ncbi:MAG: polynucleotide adenylyltransferase [Verrucomicrobia bacterium]|nr:MAG: polynucleotide adenylyltransferase [Verrucomicrobiota bacterium]
MDILLDLTEELKAASLRIANEVKSNGGRALLVGGGVRDALLGLKPKDIDIEVFGILPEKLEAILTKHFKIVKIGKSFGVLKLKGIEIDVSIPRRESKQGMGHKGFLIEGDPNLSFEEAAARRDFTINAISWDPLTGEFIDPFHGREDLRKSILRHVSDKFSEDPLRVLRAMQIAARFDLEVDKETVELCSGIEPENLAKERIFEEWKKLIVKGKRPSIGLKFLRDCGWIRYFPELEALIGCEQDPVWHPEGDVWVHTLHCMDEFARERIGDEWEDLIVGLGVLCHDVGKPVTSFTDEEGRIRSPGHDIMGVPIAREFLRRMTDEKVLIEDVLVLVETHMRPAELYKVAAGSGAIRRLANKVGRIDRLIRVVSADMGGCPPKDKGEFLVGLKWFEEQGELLKVVDQAPKPIVLGRHLIEMGMEPGKAFKKILNDCFEAQLDGQFDSLEGGLEYLKKYLEKTNR